MSLANLTICAFALGGVVQIVLYSLSWYRRLTLRPGYPELGAPQSLVIEGVTLVLGLMLVLAGISCVWLNWWFAVALAVLFELALLWCAWDFPFANTAPIGLRQVQRNQPRPLPPMPAVPSGPPKLVGPAPTPKPPPTTEKSPIWVSLLAGTRGDELQLQFSVAPTYHELGRLRDAMGGAEYSNLIDTLFGIELTPGDRDRVIWSVLSMLAEHCRRRVVIDSPELHPVWACIKEQTQSAERDG